MRTVPSTTSFLSAESHSIAFLDTTCDVPQAEQDCRVLFNSEAGQMKPNLHETLEHSTNAEYRGKIRLK